MTLFWCFVFAATGAGIGIALGNGQAIGWAFFNWSLKLPRYVCACGCPLRIHLEDRPGLSRRVGDYHCANWMDCGCHVMSVVLDAAPVKVTR